MKILVAKKAVITGGSDGIGLGIAKGFAASGADLLLVARDPEKLDRTAAELASLGGTVKTLPADLADIAGLKRLSNRIMAQWSHIDILVHNAGVARFTPVQEVSTAEFDLQVNLNVKAPYLLTQNLLPALERARGNIINISSYFAQRMIPARPSSVYSLTKGALNSLTRALAYELGPKGIRVNAIAPGTVNTPLFRDNFARLPEHDQVRFQEAIKTLYPLGRIGEPEDLAAIAVYLASDQASWVTGSIITVDGGLTTT